ncbi:MAG: response regulator [Myxococcales bacterium]|nr:response regulator [Myxococcales bacterium]
MGLHNLAVIVHTAKELTPAEVAELSSGTLSIVQKSPAGAVSLQAVLNAFLAEVGPLQTPVPIKSSTVAPELGLGLSGRTVLVVDDEVRNLSSMAAALEANGVRILVAESGQAGLDELRAQPEVVAVLMDVMMPGMDGMQATRRIRDEPAWQMLPVIAVTARAMPGDREASLAANFSDYLSKPVDMPTLLKMLSRWLTRS